MLTPIEPPVEPLLLAAAKAFLRVEIDDDDELIQDAIIAARLKCEHTCNQVYVSSRWLWTLPEGLPACVAFPLPLTSVEAIRFFDEDGVSQNLSLEDVGLTYGSPGSIHLAEALPGPVEVEFTSGPATVPKNVVQAIKHLSAFFYSSRSTDEDIPQVIRALLAPSMSYARG